MIDRIYCRNFRRLEEADIALKKGITVLIGANGSGKSSILEAILFNLFGKVKSGTKKETVIRKGIADGDVTITVVDFVMNNLHYRCRRWYSPKKSLMADLYAYTEKEYEELQKQTDILKLNKKLGTEIASSATGVNGAIENILGVSYEGFKASFMAQQKELDSMSSLSPELRKKFFLDLLGYSRLDDIKPEVSKGLRAAEDSVKIIEKQNLSAPELEKQISKYEKNIADRDGRIKKGESMVASKKNELESATKSYDESRIASEKANTISADIASLGEEQTKLTLENEELKKKIEVNTEKSYGYDENSPLATKIANLREKVSAAREYATLLEQKENLVGSLSERESQIKSNLEKIEELTKKTAEEPNLDILQNRITELKEQRASYKQNLDTLNLSMKNYEELRDAVNAGDVAKCPTCGSSISSKDGKQHLEEEIGLLQHGLLDAENALAENKKELTQTEEKLDIARMALRTFQRDSSELSRLVNENKMLGSDFDAVKQQIKNFENQILSKQSASLPQTEMRRIEDEIASMQAQLARENEMKQAYYSLQKDQLSLSNNEKRLSDIASTLKEKNDFIKQHRRVIGSLESRKTKKEKIESELEQYRTTLSRYQTERAEMSALLSAANGNLKHAQKQAEQLIELKDKIEAYIGAQQVVEFLRKNLPGRIAPRLALEASQLLDIATNGKYSMIEISDAYEVFVYTDDDIRPVSMMSGGEADVIALCIRIAIAKLILEATGVCEQTFILDEIFGALDDERRESTGHALQNIGKQLSKILCITHIDEIKDMADYTYIVEMDENGVSHVREIIDNESDFASDSN